MRNERVKKFASVVDFFQEPMPGFSFRSYGAIPSYMGTFISLFMLMYMM